MKFKEHISQAVEPVFLAMFMLWTLGISVALLNPQSSREPRGVVEIYALSAVAETKTGV